MKRLGALSLWGTGLSLTLCRKFAQLHGSKIWVTSTFTIPVRRAE